MKVLREVRDYLDEHSRVLLKSLKSKKKRRRFTRVMIIDALSAVVFWGVVNALKDIFIVGMPLQQVAVAGATGAILTLSLGGIYGQISDRIRRWTRC